jgi:hypothetical protein
MDRTQIPVKESLTSRAAPRKRLPDSRLRYIFGASQLNRKQFMPKHLRTKNPASAKPRPHRVVRHERPRANRFHTFLKRLRAGGRSNMYGAIPYLMHAFELDRESAFRIVCEWVDAEQGEARTDAPQRSAAS